MTPLTLELGGKSPAIVDATVSPDAVVSSMAWGKALNAGQVCIAPDYLLVEARAVDGIVAAFTAKWAGWFGAEVSASADYGRIVNVDQFDRLVDTLEDALSGAPKFLRRSVRSGHAVRSPPSFQGDTGHAGDEKRFSILPAGPPLGAS